MSQPRGSNANAALCLFITDTTGIYWWREFAANLPFRHLQINYGKNSPPSKSFGHASEKSLESKPSCVNITWMPIDFNDSAKIDSCIRNDGLTNFCCFFRREILKFSGESKWGKIAHHYWYPPSVLKGVFWCPNLLHLCFSTGGATPHVTYPLPESSVKPGISGEFTILLQCKLVNVISKSSCNPCIQFYMWTAIWIKVLQKIIDVQETFIYRIWMVT